MYVADGTQRLVVDEHQICCISSDGRRLGHDGYHRVAWH
jgi:hypothetical protein